MNEEKTKNNKTKTIVMVTTLLILIVSIAGISYAYFTINVTGNEETSSINVSAVTLKLLFSDGPEVNLENAHPNTVVTKTFTVTNNGTDVEYYDIKMYNVYSTIIRDELVYTLTSTNGGGTKSETIMPNNDGLILAKISIPVGVSQEYTMTITFKETGSNQNYNQRSIYRGIIQILSPYQYTNDGVKDIRLVDRIMLDNTEAYPTNTSSKYVTDPNGISYAKISDYEYNGYYTYEESVDFTSNANKSVFTEFDYRSLSGYFYISGTVEASHTYSTSDIGKYTCNTNSTSACYLDDLYKILEVDGSTVTKVLRYVAKPDKSSWNGLGLYQTNQYTEDNETTYFFRGHVINNYVSFAAKLWRIVRIAEDGTIRLVGDNTYMTNKKFNNSNVDPMYVGYMYGTSADPYANIYDSNAKIELESYYDSNLASYSSYLGDIEFCNDRSISSTSSSYICYGAYNRLRTNKSPIFTCPNEDRDLFTMSSSSKGNKKLTKSIGMMSADEMAYAGSVNNEINRDFYLKKSNVSLRTVSPSTVNLSTSNASIWYMPSSSPLFTFTNVNSGYTLRPYISLKPDTLVLGGSGTANDPYVVTQ